MNDELFDGNTCTVNLQIWKAEPQPFGLVDVIALQLVRGALESNHTEDVEASVRLAYRYARAMVKVREEV
jgi:hypothetical protein